MAYSLVGIPMKNYLVASSSPLTESLERLRCCYEAGFSAAILKSAADYVKKRIGYGRKIIYTEDGYYADASFEREILTLEEGLALYKGALKECPSDMLLIPSISASSLEPEKWISACKRFEDCGAVLLQLDFFYLGTLKQDETFFKQIGLLLTELCQNLKCAVMPKLNLNLRPERICAIFKECGIKTVSLLDSMREDPDNSFGLHKGTTSYFGYRQFPYTMQYLKVAKQYGLEVCAGGGIVSKAEVEKLLSEGANMVQTASYILNRDFSAARDLLDGGKNISDSSILTHKPWCDCENGAKCENCGACAPHKIN